MRCLLPRLLVLFLATLLTPTSHAWNAAGHRLVAAMAWEQMAPASRNFCQEALARHPDYPRWEKRARQAEGMAIFAEASTWPDDIRDDPRFDERDAKAQPDWPDNDRHKDWHYVDFSADGKRGEGQIDRQIERLSALLRSTNEMRQISWALPWLIHLLGDIHQPLHVGNAEDSGGNRIEIENPFNPRRPFAPLHSYWDDLPGPPWLRGQRLADRGHELLARHTRPSMGKVGDWRDESHRLLPLAYPDQQGSLLPIINEGFHQRSQELAERRLVAAAYRLAHLLDSIVRQRVSRETP